MLLLAGRRPGRQRGNSWTLPAALLSLRGVLAGFFPCRVFGAGYPSLATMTVDEWYDQHQKQGVLPDQGISQRAPAGPKDQQKEQENTTEEEQQAAALKAREWDDWKDVHPRGYGNRKNMG
uniref:Uncharacterized protein n=1 Tax=Micrurus surinamensis TaxID=129470 RepID=A0A2D4PSX8_MICSU